MYAILDIETTGGKYNEEGITEIAIYKYDGHSVIDKFICLINPERAIQPFVENLTGINQNMLRNAPKFYEVAKRIIEITEDCIIVAHNSNFDYRILKTEFRRLEYKFERKTLCTVQLSKKLIPDLPSYSLGKLCKSLGIPISSRHRAEGDTIATVKLFKLLLEKDQEKLIVKSTISGHENKDLAPKLLRILDDLPTTTGVYYIHETNGNILYIGKSNNIKKNVNNLFLKETASATYLQNNVTSISYESTGSELIKNLKFYNEVISNRPRFNKNRFQNVGKISFNNENFILVDKGRNISEKSVLLIENNQFKGYCYIDLSYQISNIEILKSLIAPLEDNSYTRHIIKNHLQKSSVEKIIRF